jgi:hypothetical protein
MMSLFSEIEKTIERGFRRWTDRMFGPGQSGDLVIVHRQILEEIESKVQTLARGERVFPFTRAAVTLVAADPERRAVLESAFAERLADDVREALKASGASVPRGFTVEVRTTEAGDTPFEIEYSSERPAAKAKAASAVPGRLVVVRGRAQQAEYVLAKARTNIGRLPELTDADYRVTRRNDIVFEEGADEANGTVSRRHAHIRFEDGEYRIRDDGSEFGTRVFRDGRSIDTPAGNRRGEKLRPGDEIYLGRACLRFER